jgi:formylglycine-generating enzyme required for sulfatase activity
VRARDWRLPALLLGASVTGVLLAIYLFSPPRPPHSPAVPPALPPTVPVTPPPPPAVTGPQKFKNFVGMDLVPVPRGKFWMGGKDGSTAGAHLVEMPHDFYLGACEVTQEQWQMLMGKNPSWFSRTGGGREAVAKIPDEELKTFPVEMVSWDDVQQFLAKLNAQDKDREPDWIYRLPTEAEWEYACRGGPSADKRVFGFDYYFDKPTNDVGPEQANFEYRNEPGKSLGRTCPVGSYHPNWLGLFDMHGNVWEWCNDEERQSDGTFHKVYRGGSWLGRNRAADRRTYPPTARYNNLGFRVAQVPVKK